MDRGALATQRLLGHLLGIGAQELRRRVPLDGAAILLRKDGALVVAATDPPVAFGPRAGRRPADGTLAGEVLASGTPLHVPDLREADRPRSALREGLSAGARTYLGIPLTAHDHSFGVLQVDAIEPAAFSAEDRERLLRFAASLEAAAHGVLPHGGREETRARALVTALLSLISHELRSPVTSIRGLAETLADRASSMDRELLQELATRISGASMRLHRLVGDLLDLSRIEHGIPVRPASTDVEPLVRQVAELPVSPPHEVVVDVEPDLPLVLVDPDRLQQVLENLLGNAAKFSTPGLPIRIHVRGEGDGVAVSVEDHGEGIPSDMLERVFEPGARVPRGDRPDPGGLGLGLFLVRDICRAMGAQVDVDSTEGEGTTFTVRLPRAPE